MEIGESLVGSYMRQVHGCHSIAYNTHTSRQAELDVIGVADSPEGVHVWLAEVAVHLDGLNYGGYQRTVAKIGQKVDSARSYAMQVYPQAKRTVEFWSPVVPAGLTQQLVDTLPHVHFVINDEFTQRVNELAAIARTSTSLSGDDAFRMLQLLTHLRGPRPRFGPA